MSDIKHEELKIISEEYLMDQLKLRSLGRGQRDFPGSQQKREMWDTGDGRE